jgi:hypothetical protein
MRNASDRRYKLGMPDLRQSVCAQGEGAWAFLLEGFAPIPKRLEPPSWDGCWAITESYDTLAVTRRARLLERLQVVALDRELASLGGDPLHEDWHDFRPLAVGREEGWSDWLAHLLVSGDADFIRLLFDIRELPAVPPQVRREQELLCDQADRSQGNYRSDIIVEWTEPMLRIQVEVKVGDPHLRKTWAEAQHLRSTHGGTWHHFLLVLPEQKREAERMKQAMEPPSGGLPTVTVITWEDVERELRRALLRRSTPRSWCGIARGFAGALGQLKLHRPVLVD